MNWIPAILAIGALIVVHEAGHYFVARMCSMRVERFSIGFGPAILKWRSRKTGTQFQLGPIPFGGFVEIKGMNILEEVDPNDATSYPNRPAWQRFVTIFAGPATNYLFAVILAFGVFTIAGIQSSDPALVVDGVDYGDMYTISEGGIRQRTDGDWSSLLLADPEAASPDDFRDVWGTRTELYAVGAGGIAQRVDGKWTGSPHVTRETLHGVWGSGANRVFAVGNDGTALLGSTWGWASTSTGTKAALRDVWGTGPTDVFAVGEAGTILHFDGTAFSSAWSPMTSGVTTTLNGVWAAAPDDAFAVGDGGTIVHWDGSAWSPMTSGVTARLNGVRGVGGDDVFVVGDGGTILHWNGTAWSRMTSPAEHTLTAVWGRGSASVYAVGEKGTLLHWNGAAWMTRASGTDKDLAAIWGSNESFPAEGKLLPGDRFVSIDGKPIPGDLGPSIKAVGDREAVFQVERKIDGKPTIVDLKLRPKYDEGAKAYRLGIQLRGPPRVKVGIGTAAKEAVIYPAVQSKVILVGLYEWATGKTEGRMSSVVGISQVVKQAIDAGWVIALELLMILNVYLGLFNLFPLPALDGGRLVFLGYEMVTRRRANPKLEATVHMVGVLVLAVLLVVVTINDCRHL